MAYAGGALVLIVAATLWVKRDAARAAGEEDPVDIDDDDSEEDGCGKGINHLPSVTRARRRGQGAAADV